MAAVIDINLQIVLCVQHYTIYTTYSIFLFIVCILFGVIGDNRAAPKKLWGGFVWGVPHNYVIGYMGTTVLHQELGWSKWNHARPLVINKDRSKL